MADTLKCRMCVAIIYLFLHVDLRSIATRIPQIPLKISTALELRHRLNLSSSSNQENSDLQSILMEYSESSWSLFDLVKAMMITQGVGQYTVKLLPFCKSVSKR